MPKQKGLKTLKKEMSTLFQLYCRLRDVDDTGFAKCISCPKVVHYTNADGGHYIGRTHLATLWDERNVNLQCTACNGFPDADIGNEYAIALDIKYGIGTVADLKRLKKTSKKYSPADIRELWEIYCEKIHQLKLNKGL